MSLITVLGADGFLGRHVVASLCASGEYATVRLADARVSENAHDLALLTSRSAVKIEHRICDITDLDQVRAAISGSRCVVHAAGLVDTRQGLFHDAQIYRVNVFGTACVVRACLEEESVSRLIYVSSAALLADGVWGDDAFATAGRKGSASVYGRSKWLAERCLLHHCTGHARLRTVCLRPHVVFGPGDALATGDALFATVPPPALGSADKILTPIYVKNLADFITHLSSAAGWSASGVLNVGDAHQTFSEFRALLLSCRRPAPAGNALRRILNALTEAVAPSRLTLWAAWPIATAIKLLDWLTFGTCRWKLLQLTSASLYYCDGANFRYATDGYTVADFRCRYSWPVGVQKDLAAFAAENQAQLPLPRDLLRVAPILSAFSPWKLRGMVLKNRIIKEATFEAGCDSNGVPTVDLVRFHEDVARGGAALTTVAYASVSVDGRSFGSQLLMCQASRTRLMELTAAVHRHGCRAAIQLTHAGSFADRQVTGVQQLSASAIFNAAGLDFAREMTDVDIERVTKDFADAAMLAVECGFDAVQIHCGHGYLLSQFLSPHTNWREGAFGCSSTATRVRFPLQVCRRVRETIGPDVPILVKLNMHDGFSGGVRLEHAISFAQCLEQSGLVDLVIPSGGWVSKNGFYMLRGDVPLLKMARAQRKGWIQSCALLALGPFLVPRLEWTPSYFSSDARTLKAYLTKTPVCLLGGVDSLNAVEDALAQGFVAVAVARAILREPRFVLRLLRESTERNVVRQPSPCTHCNECIVSSAMAEKPLRCALIDDF